MRRKTGFTLIELMIVVAVIGILARIAIPMYMESLRRGDIQEATTALSALKVYQEQYYQDNRTYLSSTTANACGATTGAAGTQVPNTKHFTITCTLTKNAAGNVDGQSFLGTATGSDGMTTGFVYTIDQLGNQGTTCTSCAWGSLTAAQQQTWVTAHP